MDKTNKQENLHNNIEEDSIDLIAISKKLWNFRELIGKVSLSFFIIGCLAGLLSPVVYTAETTFVPQVSDDQIPISTNKKLGSLASLAGINLTPTEITSDSYLSPLLYKKIVDSEEFSLKLLSEELINSNGEKFTVKEYLLSNKSLFDFNPISFIKKYTIGLFFNKEDDKIDADFLKNYNFISKEDYNLLKSFGSKFSIELNEKEGYIKVLASDENSFISSQLVKKVTKSLQSKIIEIRTNKIKERLKFSKEQYEIKQVEFDLLKKKLAEFKDSNKNISTARFMSELQKLESEYQLQQNILINLASEYNNNKIKLNKDTPIFSVIDEVSIPNKRSKPSRKLIVLIYSLIGLTISIIYILTKEAFLEFTRQVIKN